LERYKQGHKTLERQVRDLEADLRRAHEVHRGTERALEETDATMNALQRDISRLEEENTVMVQQIMVLTKGLQEAKDSEEEARMLHRQRMQMFHGFSARLMEATRRLGIDRLHLPSVPEDDRSIIHFFGQLSDKLAEGVTKVMELINAKCRDLLGLAGMRIFSNIQRLRPDLDLEEVLQRRVATPPDTPDRAAQARAARLDIALQHLQAIYSRSGTSSVAGHESSSSEEATSSGETDDEEAAESGDDGATESSGEASSGSCQCTGDDESSEEDAP
jgi:hypothetical protein